MRPTAHSLERLFVMCMVSVALLWAASAKALSNTGQIVDLKHTSLGPKEGVPPGVQALAQSSDGYIWVANINGLYRFDGLRFEAVHLPRDDRLTSSAIYQLYAPKTGGLWVGFHYGGAAFLLDGQMTVYGERDGFPPGTVIDFAQEDDGTVWAGTAGGLARRNGSSWQKIGAEWNYPKRTTPGVLVDSQGTLWVASGDMLYQLRRGEKSFQEKQAISGALGVGLAESPSGEIWLYDQLGVRRVHANERGSGRAVSSGHGILFDRHGAAWVASEKDLRRIAEPKSVAYSAPIKPLDLPDAFASKDGLTGDANSHALLEDREGNVWMGTHQGLNRFSERNLKRLLPSRRFQDSGFTGSATGVVPGPGHSLFVFQRTPHALWRYENGQLIKETDVLDISSAVAGRDGLTWLGTSAGVGPYQSGQMLRTDMPEYATGVYQVRAMTLDHAGGLWISNRGIHRLKDGQWTRLGGVSSLPPNTALAAWTDARGRVWFSFSGGKVAVVEDGKARLFCAADGLQVGNVTALQGRGERVWSGGEFGLALMTGTAVQPIHPDAPQAFNGITGIIERANGDVWLNCGLRIVRIPSAEIARALGEPTYQVKAEIFDALDGLQGTIQPVPVPSAVETADGLLWFVTTAGVYSVDPDRLHRNPFPPRTHVDALTADGNKHPPRGELQLPERVKTVSIDYVGLTYTQPERVRFRYKLDGHDGAWQDAGGRRQAVFTNLEPGAYRFRVMAANNDGIWSEGDASVSFVIPPAFIQTRWFIAACVAGVALLLWTVTRLRVRQVSAGLRVRYEERIAERERIARELHDTLLQSTQALTLRLQAAANEMKSDDPVRLKLETALDRAEEVMEEGRSRVLDLRVPEETIRPLPEALASAGHELASGGDVSYSATVNGVPRKLLRDVEEELFSMAREALLNAFRHADASRVQLDLDYQPASFTLSVHDDGRGIDPSLLEGGSRRGHWGLRGIRERAHQIGAAFEGSSQPGAGTRITITVPAERAYSEASGLIQWRRHLRKFLGFAGGR